MISAKNEEVIKLEAKILKSHHIFGIGVPLPGSRERGFEQHKLERTPMGVFETKVIFRAEQQ